MATKTGTDVAEDFSDLKPDLEPNTSPDYDFERSLPWLYGDRYYLQISQQDFIDLFSRRETNKNTIEKRDPDELIQIARRALGKGEFEIAEKLFVKAMRTGMLDNSNRKSPEPYIYLAEILEKKAEDKELKLLQKQRYLLQAAALYNFVRNYLESRDIDVELSKKLSKLVSGKLLDVQDNMITLCGGNPLQSGFNVERRKNELKNLRYKVKESLESIEYQSSSSDQGRLSKCQAHEAFKDLTKEMKKLSFTVSDRMKQFFASIIDECLVLLGTPPCDYEMIVFGSLARNETTPYSDFEWAILTSSEEEECKVFFRNLTNLVHLQVINLGETILPSMNIEAINGEWFYDDVTPRGVSFDGLLPQACKIPLGNMKDFELIHTPEKMAEFQTNDWYKKNWSLADTLITFSPLRSEKSVLVEGYRNEIDKILSNPCDSESCQHDDTPTRGSCRGLRVLQKDLSRYGDTMTGNSYLDEGKFYDVKKEIYRLTDRVFAALAKCYGVEATGTFAILDELSEKEVISSEARDILASASAIAIRLRLSTYLEAGKQGELLSSNLKNKTEKKALVYHMPTDEELFHFFFVTIPLYDELRQIKTPGNIPSSFANRSFFNDSDITMGHIYCRLLKYDKAIECYERAVRENPDNLNAEVRQIRLALFATHNTQESERIRKEIDIWLGKIVKNFAQLDTNVETVLEFTPLMSHLDMEECRELFEGLLYAGEIYRSPKYFTVARKIIYQFKILFASNKSMPKELHMLLLSYVKYFKKTLIQEHEIDVVVSASTQFIDEDGVCTRSIVCLNSLGEFLFNRGKLDKAYRCFQRSLNMQHLLYGARPNVNMMTSLQFLGKIARELEMYEESKFYFKSLVQRFGSFGGIRSKFLIKTTYLELLLLQGCTADESLRYAKNGLKVTTGSKNETELLLNCSFYCFLAVYLQSPEQAWKAVLNAQACWKDCTDTTRREIMIFHVIELLCKLKKLKEGIKLLKEELQKLTLKSQVQEKVLCLKALGKLCLEQGLAAEAKKYYSQAINNQEENDEHVFHDLECRIGILKAAVMEDSVANEKPVLDKAFFSSARKLPASEKKCLFMKKTGDFCKSIGEIGDARLCYIAALRSSKELLDSYEKCVFLKDIGKLCESISDIALARQCYNEALNIYKKESSISKKPPLLEFEIEMRLGMSTVDLTRRIHYDRAAAVLEQHVATEHVDSRTVSMLFTLAGQYGSIDRNEEIRLLLESLKVSEIVHGEDKPQEIVTNLLHDLSRAYFLSGDLQNSIKYRERQIEMELQLHSSSPFVERMVNTLMQWAFTSLDVPCSKDSIERVCDFFLASLNNKTFLLNCKTVAAKCFTFIAVLFYTLSDFEKAKSVNEKASQLFGEVQESDETETDLCRETCDLMKTILSSEIVLPSHRRELFVYLFNICGHYSDSVLSEEERLSQNDTDTNLINVLNEQARSTLVEEQNALSPLPTALSQLDILEYYRSTGEFQRAAEIHASLQPQLLSFYENSLFDGEEKLISEAIEAKDKNQSSKAITFLDLALQLDLPKAQSRRKSKILKLRGECFLSMGNFRSAAIDFTKADALYSVETIDSQEDFCEYCEVLIGLIKSEILCNNLDAAWLVCEKGIKLLSDHQFKGNINQQFFYYGVKCLNILSERGKDKLKNLDKAVSLCLQADSFMCDHLKMAESSISKEGIDSYHKTQLLLVNIYKKINVQENEFIEWRLQMVKTSYINIAGVYFSDSITEREPETEPETEPEMELNALLVEREAKVESLACKVDPEFVKAFAGIARVLVMEDKIEESIVWLNRSLVAFFSADLPDFMSFFEEFLPLLRAITATNTSAPDGSRSPFQKAVHMCTTTLTNQDKSLNYVNQFLTTLIIIYRSLGQAQEALVVAEISLQITDLMYDNSDNDQLNNRCRMLLHLAQIHQQNSSNPAFNTDEELNLAEQYYLSDRGREEDMVLCKDLSYANFLCERRRFAEAAAVLEDMRNFGKLLRNKYVYIEYFSCAFYGAGVEKSVTMDGELLTAIEAVLNNLLVRAYIGMGKKKEAVATCEILTDVDLLDVQEAFFGKRPFCKLYLVADCHRELLSLLNDEDRHQFQNCDFPLSSANLAKFYYMLNEYEMAAKYLPKDVATVEMLEIKISCLRLAGNELVDLNRGDESIFFFHQFFKMLQDKEGFMDKPFYNQCEILQTDSFPNQYYLFHSLGAMHAGRENIDAAIQCYERCIELDEDFTCGQDIVATLSELYQTKALTVDLDNEDSRSVYMDLAWELFQKLFQKTAELTTFVELSYASLLTRLGRYEEAAEHFYIVMDTADFQSHLSYGNLDKPLVDVHLRREIEALGGSVVIPIVVVAVYELISTLMKMHQIRKAQKVAFWLETVVRNYPTSPVKEVITHSMPGYAYKIIGNKEKAKEIFVSVLEKNPGHPPVTEALESLCM